jgi:hypothetical protein
LVTTRAATFRDELFLVQSPILKESLLVSFPPLNYMLKFGGSSYTNQIFSEVSIIEVEATKSLLEEPSAQIPNLVVI